MNREYWRKLWLECINELTSLDVQQRSWLDINNTNPHWSFIEFLEVYFDDLQIIDMNYDHFIRVGFVKQEEYEVIKEWHEKLSKYEPPNNDEYDHANILNDLNWQSIVSIGLESKKKLAELLSVDEKAILTEVINVA